MLAFGNSNEEIPRGSHYESHEPSRSSATDPSSLNGNSGRWLTIHAACEILGVDKSTLRRWSDRGRVPVFRTPGGHRRYSEDDLHAFLAGDFGQHRQVSRRELAAVTREEIQRFKPRSYAGDILTPDAANRWPADMHQVCDRMVDLSVRYTSGKGNADKLLSEARELAGEFGRCTAGASLRTSEAVEAFLRFRRPLLDGLGRYVEEKNLPVRRSCRMLGKLNIYLDVVLTSVVEAHEAFSET